MPRGTSIVILNEGLSYAPAQGLRPGGRPEKLRPLGYRFLAIETLTGETSASGGSPLDRLRRDGVVRMGTGGYSKDPVFARFIGTAIPERLYAGLPMSKQRHRVWGSGT